MIICCRLGVRVKFERLVERLPGLQTHAYTIRLAHNWNQKISTHKSGATTKLTSIGGGASLNNQVSFLCCIAHHSSLCWNHVVGTRIGSNISGLLHEIRLYRHWICWNAPMVPRDYEGLDRSDRYNFRSPHVIMNFRATACYSGDCCHWYANITLVAPKCPWSRSWSRYYNGHAQQLVPKPVLELNNETLEIRFFARSSHVTFSANSTTGLGAICVVSIGIADCGQQIIPHNVFWLMPFLSTPNPVDGVGITEPAHGRSSEKVSWMECRSS